MPFIFVSAPAPRTQAAPLTLIPCFASAEFAQIQEDGSGYTSPAFFNVAIPANSARTGPCAFIYCLIHKEGGGGNRYENKLWRENRIKFPHAHGWLLGAGNGLGLSMCSFISVHTSRRVHGDSSQRPSFVGFLGELTHVSFEAGPLLRYLQLLHVKAEKGSSNLEKE